MKIGVSGKGGVGKTTFSAMLTGALALRGRSVIAIDADPDTNLAAALGAPADEEPSPISEMRELIAERTASGSDLGGYFKLNPKVDDIPDEYAYRVGPIRLLTLGGVSKGGGGCICPATALIKALLMHLILGRDETIIMDMEAGIEHLGRATTQSMDALLLVVNESPWSIQTALRVQGLAGQIGLKRVFAVANRLTGSADVEAIRRQLGDIPLVGSLPEDPRLGKAILHAGVNGGIEAGRALQDHLPAVEGILAEMAG